RLGSNGLTTVSGATSFRPRILTTTTSRQVRRRRQRSCHLALLSIHRISSRHTRVAARSHGRRNCRVRSFVKSQLQDSRVDDRSVLGIARTQVVVGYAGDSRETQQCRKSQTSGPEPSLLETAFI